MRKKHPDTFKTFQNAGKDPYIKLDVDNGETHLRKFGEDRLPFTGRHYIEDADLKIPKTHIIDRIFNRMDKHKVDMAYRAMHKVKSNKKDYVHE